MTDTKVNRLEKCIEQLDRQYNELFNGFFEDHSAIKLLIDPVTGQIARANKAACAYYGYAKPDLESMIITDINQRSRQAVFENMKQAGSKEQTYFEFRHKLASGEIRDVEVYSSPLQFNGKQILLSVVHDITEKKESEQKIQESESFYHMLFTDAQDILFIHSEDGRLLDANHQATELLGYSREELLQKNKAEITIPTQENRENDQKDKLLSDETQVIETAYIAKDGSSIPVESNSRRFSHKGKTAIFTIGRSMIRRKEQESLFRRLSTAVEQSPSEIVITDLDGRIEYANPRFTALTGYSLREAKGKRPNILKSGYFTDEEYKALWETISSGHVWKGEMYNKTKQGAYYWEEAAIAPIVDENGTISNYVKVGEDCTHRKQIEQNLQETLEERTVLLREIHHRVKNNLTIITSLLNFQKTLSTDENLQTELDEAQGRIRSMAMIHEHLYGSVNLKEIDFSVYVQELISHLASSYSNKRGTTIEPIIAVENVTLDIERAIPCGLILNELITNEYRHAFPDQTKGEYCIDFRKEDDRYILSLTDNGIGLPKDFEKKHASSMGLLIVDTLVSQLQGTISYTPSAKSSGYLRDGAMVTISFPTEKDSH